MITPQVDTGPNLLLNWQRPDKSSRIVRAGVGSVIAHVLIMSFLVTVASLDTNSPEPPVEIAKAHKLVTPLIAPPTHLTQKEPNRAKVPKEVKLENLLPEKQIAQRIPAPPQPAQKLFKAPPQSPAPPAPKPAPAQLLPETPRIEASMKTPQLLPPSPAVQPPPPQIQPVEQPKLALETPGQSGTAVEKGGVKIPTYKASVQEAMHSIARGGGEGGMIVGDADQTRSLGDQLRRPSSPGKTASSLELLSDPMGVDFKPYLIRILATVRRNWFAVIPESVRLGRRGKVTLQFAIDRSGGVPKLVIATPSGAESLDRAAVAGISASVPFPPLPKEFPGQQIRLQFAFQYNMQ